MKTRVKTSIYKDCTLPDQSLSIRQIMDRFARGLPVEGQSTSIFEEADENPSDLPDLTDMDPADRLDYLDSVREELAEKKEKLSRKVIKPVESKAKKSHSTVTEGEADDASEPEEAKPKGKRPQ